MAGLLAARALADHFERVTVLEQDHLASGPELRKGVPQARHGHGLLGKGSQVLESFFPGIAADLVTQGALEMDPARDSRWYQGGVLKTNFDSDMRVLGVSRAMLEWRTREHLLRHAGVRLRDGVRVRGLVADGVGQRIRGVELTTGEGEERLEADLVVDASGRGSRAPHWLEALGFTGLETSVITSDVGYATRVYRRPDPGPRWKYLLQIPLAPDKRLGVILPMEGGRWMVTLTGYHGAHPPSDEAGFLAYARALAYPDLYEAIRDAEPLSDIALYKIPSSQRRHYERMPRFPDGFAVLGDAACCFNPIFAQGMTTAALGAATLRDCLGAQAREAGSLEGFSRRFQKALARVTNLPWQAVASEDFRYPETTGPKAPGAEVMNWYMGRVQRLCAHDPDVMRRFVGVMHMVDSPAVLFNPRTVLKVLLAGGGSSAAMAPVAPSAASMDRAA
jgi:2-polyprenyl-6-methoxyphenol hydroxylase-like FAD-dependent oxidoreductase